MDKKLKGIIVYEPEDVCKNKKFIQMCIENLNEYNIEVSLIVLNSRNQTNICESIDFNVENIDFAINRSRNKAIAEELESCGIRVFNSANVTEICNDKWKTYLYAKNIGIPLMETYKGERESETLHSQHSEISYPFIIKSCDGHGGSEVFLISNEAEEKEALSIISGEYIIQNLGDTKGRDIRAYIIGNNIVTAMCRTAKEGFKSNFSLGGDATQYRLNEKETEMIRSVMENLKPDYAGIDFFYDGDRLVLNEIEDAVGARMVYENTNIDIVKQYTDYIQAELNKY